MQPMGMHRPGLGMRSNQPLGQGTSNPPPSFVQAQQPTQAYSVFVGSISSGITDAFLNRLLSACGQVRSFKRLITPANKPQGFGFAEFEEPDAALRCIELLNGVELPALEDGAANKKLLVKVDEKTKLFLDAFAQAQIKTDQDEDFTRQAKATVEELVSEINKISDDANGADGSNKEKYIIPPHLHDLQEADVPEAQRGLVISEIAQFRERSAKREKEKERQNSYEQRNFYQAVSAPSGPKQREWGKNQNRHDEPHGRSDSRGSRYSGSQDRDSGYSRDQGYGSGPQSYQKPVGFVRENGGQESPKSRTKTDEEVEGERRNARKRDEEDSYRDRERRYEPRERIRIQNLDRNVARIHAIQEAEQRDRSEMASRLAIWDDEESDEVFYVERAKWRAQRARRVAAEQKADQESKIFEEREVENLRIESEQFLARQMQDMQALADEQRKAGLLLDDGAPVKLSVSLADSAAKKEVTETKAAVLLQDDEEEAGTRRRAPLVKLDFSAAEGIDAEKTKERLLKIKEKVPKDKDALFKAKVRWDGMTDVLVDRKFDPLVKRLIQKYLGEVDDDLLMFVLEHLKDHKPPKQLVEGLEPVLEEEAAELALGIWRQVIFESVAYEEGLFTDRMLVDPEETS